MADERVVIEITDGVSPNVSKKIQQIAIDSRSAYSSVNLLKDALAQLSSINPVDKLSSELSRLNSELNKSATTQSKLTAEQTKAATAAQRLATEQQKTATATARTATAQSQSAAAAQRLASATSQAESAQSKAAITALRLQRAQDRAADAAKRHSTSIGALVRNTALFLGVGFSAAGILRNADAYTILQNKLQNVADSEQQVIELTEKLFQVSNRTRTPVLETTQAFQRFDLALKGLGKSQLESLALTETVNKALVLSGATTNEQASALLQLSQAFNKGKLDGDEFRSVMELMPSAADAIAKRLKVTRGELLKLAPQGKITAKVMLDAFTEAAEGIDAKFGKTIPTLGQSLVVLKNNATQAFGELNKAIGLTEGIAKGIIFLANHMKELLVILTAVGATLLVVFGPKLALAIINSTSALKLFNIAMAANPLGLLIVGLSTALAYLALFGDDIKLTSDGLITLGDVFKSFDNAVANGINTVTDYFNAWFDNEGKLSAFLSKWRNAVSEINNEALKSNPALGNSGFVSNLKNVLVSGAEDEGRTRRLAKGVRGNPSSLRGSSEVKDLSKITEATESRANALEKVNFHLDNELQRLSLLKPEREVQGQFDRIEEQLLSKKIKLNEAESQALKNKIADLETAKNVQQEFDRIYQSSIGVQNDYINVLKGIDLALSKGIISQSQYTSEMNRAKESYLSATDPLHQVNKELDEQLKLLRMLPQERQIEQQMIQIVNDAISRGLPLQQEEIDKLREKLELVQQVNAVSQQEASLLEGSVGARQQQIDQMTAMNNLLANPDSGFTKTDALNSLSGSEVGGFLTGSPEMLQAEVDSLGEMYGQIDELRNADLISEQTAWGSKVKVWAAQQNLQLQTSKTFFGSLEGLQKSSNSKLAAIGKAAAISNALISTYQAATGAFAAMASIPFVGPVLGAAAAAAAVVSGLAQVAQIRSQPTGFQDGGYTGNAAVNAIAGVVHGREYVMDAATTQRIGVNNLDALRRGAADVAQNGAQAGGASGAGSQSASVGGSQNVNNNEVNLRTINLIDPNLLGDYMSSSEGEQVFINTISRNAEIIKRVIS